MLERVVVTSAAAGLVRRAKAKLAPVVLNRSGRGDTAPMCLARTHAFGTQAFCKVPAAKVAA